MKGKLKKMLALLAVCLTVHIAAAQITGTVKGEDGEPMPGVSVVVKGSGRGVITQFDGKYSIDAQTGDVLVFAFIGMATQEIKVTGNNIVDAVMKEGASAIDEVIVVAYGTTTRSQFTGSANVVSGEKIASISTSDVTNALQGKAAGVQVVNSSGQPGDGATIRIRGTGSVNGGTAPLYVVDGVPFERTNMNIINPHDIESMTVLKDASATAIYGARGANGVVLITTKKGTSGKPIVSVETKWGVSSRGVPNYNVMTDPAMYYETAYKALFNSQIYLGESAADAYNYADTAFLGQSGVGYQIYTVPFGERLIGTNFKLNPHATLGYSDGKYFYRPDNWEKESIKPNNLRQEYNASVQGGNAETQYFISAGYLDDPGIIRGSGFERYTLRAKMDSQVKKWLKMGASASYGLSNYQNPGSQNSWGSSGNMFWIANMMAPIYPFYVRNVDGSKKVDERGIQIYDQGNTTNFVRPGSAPKGNPAINLLLDENYAYSDHFNGSLYATLTPIDGLSLTARVSPEAVNVRERNLVNPFYSSYVTEGGAVAIAHTRWFTTNQQYIASYKKSINDDHKVEVLAGYESYSELLQSLVAQNDHLFSPYIGELDNAFGTEPGGKSSSTEQLATAGYFGRLQYDFLDRYFFNATVRREASSRFAPDKRWGTFGSVGAAWSVTKESFMDFSREWVDELKLKVSYGTQGNDQLRHRYAYRDLYEISYNSTTGEFSKTLSGKGNPDLTWEAQKLFNTGLEFTVLDHKLSGSIEYFSRVNDDMLFNVPMPPTAGYSREPQNVGSVVNKGFEVELNADIIDKNDLKWSVFANITHIKSTVKKLPDYIKTIGYLEWSSSSILKEGGSLNQAFLVEYAGVDKETGEALYYVDPDKGDRSTTSDYSATQRTDLGDISVKYYGGFGTNVEAYGFDLGVSFAYQLGGKTYDGGYQELMHTGAQIGRNWHMDILNAWTPENTATDVPRISAQDDHDQKNSSRFLISSNYLSLNNITLGYTLPSKWAKKIEVNKVRVYFSGDNLAVWSARKGFDPRQGVNAMAVGLNGATSSGNYVYSQLRVVSGGLSFTF